MKVSKTLPAGSSSIARGRTRDRLLSTFTLRWRVPTQWAAALMAELEHCTESVRQWRIEHTPSSSRGNFSSSYLELAAYTQPTRFHELRMVVSRRYPR